MMAGTGVVAVEYYNGGVVRKYTREGTSSKPSGSGDLLDKCQRFLSSTFLPEGYPSSVTSDYLSFQVWDTLQALCSYIRGMMASHAILSGSGMMSPGSSAALSAIYMFFLRDLTGMLGGILFAKMQGSSFDSDAKSWRLFADVANDIGMAVELASPMFPKAFMFLACFGSLARAVTGVAGGATRAALTHHFAACGNAADVAAKEQSQEIATTMVGMILGMLLTNITATQSTVSPTLPGGLKTVGYAASHRAVLAWILFALLTVFHVYANVRAMRCLVLRSLNGSRLQLLLQLYLNKQEQQQLKAEDYILIPSTTSTAVLTTSVGKSLRPLGGREMTGLAAGEGGSGGGGRVEGGVAVDDDALLVQRSASVGDLEDVWTGLPSPAAMAGMEDLCPPPIRRLMSHMLGLGAPFPYIRFGVPLSSLAQDIKESKQDPTVTAVAIDNMTHPATGSDSPEQPQHLQQQLQQQQQKPTAAGAFIANLLHLNRLESYIVRLCAHNIPVIYPEHMTVDVSMPAPVPAVSPHFSETQAISLKQAQFVRTVQSAETMTAATALPENSDFAHRTHVVQVALHRYTTPEQRMCAYIHALHLWFTAVVTSEQNGMTAISVRDVGVSATSAAANSGVAESLKTGSPRGDGSVPGRQRLSERGFADAAAAVSKAWMTKHYEDFTEALGQSGWAVDRLLMPLPVWTASWGDDLHED